AKPEAEVVLLHSRFRPGDRQRHVAKALEPPDASGPGLVVISTQVVEAGVDISAATLVTDAAPWPSVVQRAGRCNRDGLASSARLLWLPVSGSDLGPYRAEDVEAASRELDRLEGIPVTPVSLRERKVAVTCPVYQVLRKVDLLGLFDTAPDMSGNDVDIS
ncbi:atp-dependent rna helicase related protein, partial [mine drainage metagenome]